MDELRRARPGSLARKDLSGPNPLAKEILGIHHVTAIAGEPQQNLDFYAGFLGLRLVKLTVNYDDLETYHLYYGDELGHPGTILTFFPWPGAPKGQRGSGQAVATSFSIPEKAIDYWTSRLKAHRVLFQGPTERFDERVISLSDPDGLSLELVSSTRSDRGKMRDKGPVPIEYAIRGFHHVTLSQRESGPTARLLTEIMGFRSSGREGDRLRFETGLGGPGATVDVILQPGLPRGLISVGTVHHVAWRTPTDEEQKAWRAVLVETGLKPTPV